MVSKALVVGAYQRKLEELAKLPGIELTAIVPPSWHDCRGHRKLDRTHTHGYELLTAALAFNGSYHCHFYPTLGRLLHRLRPDILHMDEEPYNLATWHGLRLAQACGAASLFFTWQNLPRRYPWPFSFFEQANYRRAACAIAGNEAAIAVLRSKGYRGPVTVIPQFGVDPEIFRPATAAERGTHGNEEPQGDAPSSAAFGVGYAGGLVPEKGVDLLLPACAGLSGAWSLTILGEGPERGRLAAQAERLGIAGRVRFLGHRPSMELPAIYRTWDVLVLPSRSRPNWVEQFGRVLIEAMACGVPVIAARTGELPNVIGDAGLLFEEGDVDGLTSALAALAADGSRRAELGQRGRARVLARFTQAQVAAATYHVYQQIYRVN
jgi:glycosyltransferase involved in cell wall biosynthesis